MQEYCEEKEESLDKNALVEGKSRTEEVDEHDGQINNNEWFHISIFYDDLCTTKFSEGDCKMELGINFALKLM